VNLENLFSELNKILEKGNDMSLTTQMKLVYDNKGYIKVDSVPAVVDKKDFESSEIWNDFHFEVAKLAAEAYNKCLDLQKKRMGAGGKTLSSDILALTQEGYPVYNVVSFFNKKQATK
jgi:hypothetical protein